MFGEDVRFVERAEGRFMGDEYIRIVRDEIPVLADLDQALSCKSPIPPTELTGDPQNFSPSRVIPES